MEFINEVKIYSQELRLDKKITEIRVKVYYDEDSVHFLNVPLEELYFFDQESKTYRPPEGDKRRYKARVTASWYSAAGVQKGQIHGIDHTVEGLVDADQVVVIKPVSSERDFALEIYRRSDLIVRKGDLFMVNAANELLHYHHDRNGEFDDWRGRVIGWSWGDITWMGASRDGSVYAVSKDGQLRHYRLGANGQFEDAKGRVIGNGWTGVRPIGVARFGELYAINPAGDLLYYKHDASFAFAISGKVIGTGWGGFSRTFTGGDNCIYAVNTAGDLLYYYHDDAFNFKHAGVKIGDGWGALTSATSSGAGEIYAVDANGALRFYRHDVDRKWLPGSGREIGKGWGAHGAPGIVAAAH